MRLSREFLRKMGIEDDKIEIIMETHVDIVNSLKSQIDDAKENSEKVKELQAEIKKVNESLKSAEEKVKAYEEGDYENKYKSLSGEYEKFKADTAAKESAAKSKSELRDYLTAKGYSDSAAKLIVNRSDYFSKIEYDNSGKAKNLDSVLKDIQSESDFAGFTPKIEEKGHTPENPPANNNPAFKSKKEILEIKDATERQAEIKKAILGGSDEFHY